MIEDLERQRLIRKIPPDPKRVVDVMALARRDLETARTLLSGHTISPTTQSSRPARLSCLPGDIARTVRISTSRW